MMKLIDCRAIAGGINTQTAETVATLTAAGTQVTLAVLQPVADDASSWYLRSITKAATKAGILCTAVTMHDATPDAVISQLQQWSADPAIHGILCLTPLPAGMTLPELGCHIDVSKDIDGANPVSLALLATGKTKFVPATAAAVMSILTTQEIPLAGARVTVVGRSLVVGKPVALLMVEADATVTVAHSRTTDLEAVCRTADIIVAAAGRSGLIGGNHIKPGAVVIDVGTNPSIDGGFTGDADIATLGAAYVVTPVPNGVGLVTTACLLAHTAQAAQQQRKERQARYDQGGSLKPGVITEVNNTGKPIPVNAPPPDRYRTLLDKHQKPA